MILMDAAIRMKIPTTITTESVMALIYARPVSWDGSPVPAMITTATDARIPLKTTTETMTSFLTQLTFVHKAILVGLPAQLLIMILTVAKILLKTLTMITMVFWMDPMLVLLVHLVGPHPLLRTVILMVAGILMKTQMMTMMMFPILWIPARMAIWGGLPLRQPIMIPTVAGMLLRKIPTMTMIQYLMQRIRVKPERLAGLRRL